MEYCVVFVNMHSLLFILFSIATVSINNTLADGNHSEYLGKIRSDIPKSSNVCSTRVCIETAKRLKESMDMSVDPCDNFYNFACGNFVKTEKIPEHEITTSRFTKVDREVMKQILPLLKRAKKGSDDLRAFKMARYYYHICLREDLIEDRGIGFVLDLLKKLGGWPVLEGSKWNDNTFNWIETTYKMQDHNLDGNIIKVSVGADYSNSIKNVIQITQPSLGLDKEHLLNGRGDEEVEAYGSYMADIATLFGADHKFAVSEMSKVLDFEIELANITLNTREFNDYNKINNPMTIIGLQKRYPLVNWLEYLRTILNSTVFNSNEVVIVLTPTYFDKLSTILKRTKKRTIANYMLWISIKSMLDILPKAIRDRSDKYYNAKSNNPRWEDCLLLTTKRFSLAVSAMYVRNVFSRNSKKIALDIVERIRQEMINVLKNVVWMDEDTRQKALKKIEAMKDLVAFPDELLDNNKIEEYYKELEITGEQFFESIMKLCKFKWNYIISKLREENNRSDWRNIKDTTEVNAFNDPFNNVIGIPAGILQNPFFSLHQPTYMNYGAIGWIIGHEITHGFDDKGKKLDALGNLVDWWKRQTTEEFKKRKQCVIDEANNYTLESISKSIKEILTEEENTAKLYPDIGEIKVSELPYKSWLPEDIKMTGFLTQGENIADIGGIKLSELAYKSWLAENHEDPRLVGLEQFSPIQMFWLSGANIWCSVMRPDTSTTTIMIDNHALSEYRVNNAFSNHETFGEDFHCPIGSKMNPINKCNVW